MKIRIHFLGRPLLALCLLLASITAIDRVEAASDWRNKISNYCAAALICVASGCVNSNRSSDFHSSQVLSNVQGMTVLRSEPENHSGMQEWRNSMIEPSPETRTKVLGALSINAEKYPTGFLKNVVSEGVFLSFLPAKNSRAPNGFTSKKEPARLDLVIIVRDNSQSIEDRIPLAETFDHELGHLILNRVGDAEFRSAWLALNPKDFKYKNQGEEFTSFTTMFRAPQPHWRNWYPWFAPLAGGDYVSKGFASLYAQSSFEEDFAETVAVAMSPFLRERWDELKVMTPILCEKIKLVMEAFIKVDPRFMDYFPKS